MLHWSETQAAVMVSAVVCAFGALLSEPSGGEKASIVPYSYGCKNN